MSDIFWDNLELPQPDFRLDVKGEGVVDIIGKTILGINEVVKKIKFDLVIVFGDVNATVAGAIVAAQSGLKLMHVEAGLRSFDRSMPEEINRIITDHVSDYLMVSEQAGIDNLEHEGFNPDKYSLVGNIMIESLLKTKHKWENSEVAEDIEAVIHTKPAVLTFHRPENVDTEDCLKRVVGIITRVSERYNVIFPIHPRTKSKLSQYQLFDKLAKNKKILLTEPLSYFSFLKIVSKAGVVITDSGGIQEETSFLNIPCVTFRKNTEWSITTTLGTNTLLNIWQEDFFEEIQKHVDNIVSREPLKIPYHDNEVSLRIVNFIQKVL
jgi:UDP-N-acetylglucosamine 2-epimerase (non-hydrolysing)